MAKLRLNLWNEGRIRRAIEDATIPAMKAGADFLVEKIRDEIDDPYPPASLPGNPPHARSYELYWSIGSGIDGRNVFIRAGKEYASYLEDGTANMEPRPFFYGTIEDNLDDALKIVADVSRRRFGR